MFSASEASDVQARGFTEVCRAPFCSRGGMEISAKSGHHSAITDSLALPDPLTPSTAAWRRGVLGRSTGSVLGRSISVGAVRSARCRPPTFCRTREQVMRFSLEPGIAGGRASGGLGQIFGSLGSAWSARVTGLRRWDKGAGTYVGAERSAMPALLFGARAGIFRATTRRACAPRCTFSTLEFTVGL